MAMVVLSENEPDIMTVCERGFGKRTPMSEYRLQGRGGSGVINCKVTDRNGPVTNVCTVAADDQVMIVSDRGMMIRMRVKQISTQGRASQGVRLISLEKDEVVSSVARIAERDDDDNGNTNEQTET